MTKSEERNIKFLMKVQLFEMKLPGIKITGNPFWKINHLLEITWKMTTPSSKYTLLLNASLFVYAYLSSDNYVIFKSLDPCTRQKYASSYEDWQDFQYFLTNLVHSKALKRKHFHDITYHNMQRHTATNHNIKQHNNT